MVEMNDELTQKDRLAIMLTAFHIVALVMGAEIQCNRNTLLAFKLISRLGKFEDSGPGTMLRELDLIIAEEQLDH
jgi:hypothetical protein